jgi:hypothetical protein
MKSSKRIATKYFSKSTTLLILVTSLLSCQSGPKSSSTGLQVELNAQSVKGSVTTSTYQTKSDVVVYDKDKVSKKYTDSVKFDIDRTTINVNDKGDLQFRITTSNKTGNVELKDLAYPEPDQELYEMIDQYGKPLVVKDMPIGSIYYISRVALPKGPVKKNDTWLYKARWISEDTGWPFEISISSKLKSWTECDGLACAIITFEGEVSLPEDFPLKSTLTSKIKGEFHYAPISYEVLWGESKSEEEFIITPILKKIKVKSRSCSFKRGYSKNC